MASPVRVSEMIASHAVLDHEMTDHRLDGGTPPNSRLICGVTRLLTCGENSELIIGRRVVAAMSGIGDDAIERLADKRLHGSGITIASTWPLSPSYHACPRGDRTVGLGQACGHGRRSLRAYGRAHALSYLMKPLRDQAARAFKEK